MSPDPVQTAFATAAVFTPEPPRPLRRDLPPGECYPVDALGALLGAAARAIHDTVRSPVAVCAQAVLGAAAIAVQGQADVVLPTGSPRPASLFLVSVAESGERKSATDEVALWPVRKREAALREPYEAELSAYANAKDAWDRQRAQVLGDRKRHPDRETKRRALEDLGPAPQPPLVPMLTCPEPTYEGLVKLLQDGHPSLGVFSAEGGQFIAGHAMKEESKIKTAAGLSGLWDGEAVKRVRAGDGAFALVGRRLSLHLMMQPAIAAGLLCDAALTDQGLLSRLLVTAPETTAGTRFWRDATPESEAAIRRYGGRLLDILEVPAPLAEGARNALEPRRLEMSARSRRTWIAFADHIEGQVGPGGALEAVRGLANKLPEHAARIAAVLALTADISCPELAAAHLAAGIEIAQFHLGEALRLWAAGRGDPEIQLAERLLAWLQTDWSEPLVSLPDIYQLGPNAIRDKRRAERTVRLLEEHGWMVPVEGGGTVNGHHRRAVWRVVRESLR